ncbi:hypothetical protein UFOVP1188_44 [uncultured Caudovirales phage]|uniref:Uncharacterized protein n=1 Tax=uncultured Caudovirales phage TaxID=2100421 RepID=A0A6J5QV86_9CAUD|nr:hypothetical protein UFOVP1029_44 [uncultured Caudovirales phage]CAB4185261.1 hypothetical protein UFOVP1129_44 [uncultured Caudovirales phage]CAB4189433.1 hypothetical protein UFOVP1188_44 [uncultured Caudovirales phage]CAB4217016.1 hypothetical protein UFOVP1490_3 [uncultured Caudovirales phage]CAB4220579.1 hypothetical protein UFOVP1633_44 [uncultured Caudovirales phage]
MKRKIELQYRGHELLFYKDNSGVIRCEAYKGEKMYAFQNMVKGQMATWDNWVSAIRDVADSLDRDEDDK